MSNIKGDKIFEENIYLVETTDLALGGNDGVANTGVKQLANRTMFLKTAIEGYYGVQSFNQSQSLTADNLLNFLVLINANSSSLSYTLPALSDADLFIGARACIKAINVNQRQVKLSAAGSDKIILHGAVADATGTIYLGDGDSVNLVVTALGWMVESFRGNFVDTGGILYRYRQVPNTVVANGQLLDRLAYPRLWEWAQGLGSSLAADLSWQSSQSKHGFFSTGKGSTTFRVPDLRSMFIRGLDLGAGLDFNRIDDLAGGYEADEIKSHTHPWEADVSNDNLGGSGYVASSNSPSGTGKDSLHARVGATGGMETRPKNIGLIPLIKV